MSEPLEPAADELRHALAEGWLPIREVARRTGVNPVTLRAWERRYGLIVPQRTPKGHRLYGEAQVARIQAILAWLNRGVAVGQVRDLLDTHDQPREAPVGLWETQRHTLVEAIEALAERRLDEAINRAMALYPAVTLCERLLLPLLEDLERRWQARFGAQAQRVFFHGWLRSKLGARLYHHNQQQGGRPLLLANLSERPLEPGLWLSAWLLSCAGCPVRVFDWPLPTAELIFAVERIAPRALLLYSSQALDGPRLQRQLTKLSASLGIPLVLAGPVAHIHGARLADVAGLALAIDPPAALRHLQDAGLLDNTAEP
ncbi:MerR family transcriptional regulator [Pseudomonas sp. RIT-PI-AD]|uniref:MerR family transcriptional regulator n=1 Tax=Pseudomonas sp. RIT-PI-AD TaxID=3035294 RepID=UPI0021DAC4AC|nr:MerR family transcriptional regulator [Pseudomonas sp. RIT-PI-AD]